MPGIAVIISVTRDPQECQNLVQVMTEAMQLEAFHETGTQSFPQLGIYGGWAAHQKSAAAPQPFLSRDRQIALLFAGECYFDRDDRPASSSEDDSMGATIVKLYEAKGRDSFAQLNGIYSGLLIDQRQGEAFLFNDRYGIERLYYHEAKDAVFIASEAKALLKVLPGTREFDKDGVAEYLTYGCVLEGRTLFRHVRTAPGGTLWAIGSGSIRKERYFSPEQWEAQPALTETQFDDAFAEVFHRILPRYCASKSPLGISLTGGLDTRMIMASLPQCSTAPVTYTFGGLAGTSKTLDEEIARQVAQVCGLQHRTLNLDQSFFSNFGSYADRTVYNTDGCSGALGAHEIFFHEQARKLSAVRLTGNYGSEVLRSMSTFKPLGLNASLVSPDLVGKINQCGAHLNGSSDNPVAFAAFKEIPWNLFGTLAAGRSQITFRTPYLDNEVVALAFRAPLSARTSPASAVRYVRQANPGLGAIPTDRGQAGQGGKVASALRKAHASVCFKLDYMCSEGLPYGLSAFDTIYRNCNRFLGILGQHKFLQYRRWLQSELHEFARERVAESKLPFWNQPFLKSMVQEHRSGRRNHGREINAVITLSAVERLMLRGESIKNS